MPVEGSALPIRQPPGRRNTHRGPGRPSGAFIALFDNFRVIADVGSVHCGPGAPNSTEASNGNPCIAGPIHRIGSVGGAAPPGAVLQVGASGVMALPLDLGAFPDGPVVAGETWSFQAWHRDIEGLGSNPTEGLEVTFE